MKEQETMGKIETQEILFKNKKKLFHNEGCQILEQVAQSLGISTFGHFQNWTKHPALADTAYS